MLRYLSLIWNSADPQSAALSQSLRTRLCANSQDWITAVDTPGLCVLYADVRPPAWDVYALHGSSGVVLGTLFDSDGQVLSGAAPAATGLGFNSAESASIVASAGRHLIRHYWGRYVAFIRDITGLRTCVLRDPQGGLPCFVTKVDGVTIVYSNVEDLLALNAIRLTTNLRYAAAFACYPVVAGHETGLNEIEEITPGECLEVSADGAALRTLYWNPVAIASGQNLENPKEAAAAIRDTTERCVAAWACCHRSIIHRLSGGLDSSIVLACLSSTPSKPAVTCLTYYCNTVTEDEREFARLATHAARCELIERAESTATVRLRDILDIRKSPKPGCYQEAARHSRFEEALAVERNATAMFSGVGGDHIFYQGPLSLVPADYLYGRLLRPGFLRLALSVARTERSSLWSVLNAAIRNGVLRPRWNPLDDAPKYQLLVTKEIVQSTMSHHEYIHPWLRNCGNLPPGKLSQIQMIGTLTPYGYHPFGLPNYPDVVSPFISQPLIELCLCIPAYVLSACGIDRSAERAAFEGVVPSAILRRRAKGSVDTYLFELLQLNLPLVREIMLDGVMVKERFLDKEKLERVLSVSEPWWGPEGLEVLCDHLSTEVWLRSWS